MCPRDRRRRPRTRCWAAGRVDTRGDAAGSVRTARRAPDAGTLQSVDCGCVAAGGAIEADYNSAAPIIFDAAVDPVVLESLLQSTEYRGSIAQTTSYCAGLSNDLESPDSIRILFIWVQE